MLNLFSRSSKKKNESTKVYPNEVHIFAKMLYVTLITLMALIFINYSMYQRKIFLMTFRTGCQYKS
jgi:hypothetical protein